MAYITDEEVLIQLGISEGNEPINYKDIYNDSVKLIEYVTSNRFDSANPAHLSAFNYAVVQQVRLWILNPTLHQSTVSSTFAVKSKTIGKAKVDYDTSQAVESSIVGVARFGLSKLGYMELEKNGLLYRGGC